MKSKVLTFPFEVDDVVTDDSHVALRRFHKQST